MSKRSPVHLSASETAPGPEKPEQKPDGVCVDIAKLEDDARRQLDDLLADGATFEDVVETFNQRGASRVTLQAVESYFRSNLDLQKRRAQKQVERFLELKKALGDSSAGPETAEARLAAAVLLTGLLGLSRDHPALTLKDALRARLERENLSLKNQEMRLKVRKDVQEMKIRRVQEQLLRKKLDLITGEVKEMHARIEKHENPEKLGPEAIQKIQEIYGIVTLPNIPADEICR